MLSIEAADSKMSFEVNLETLSVAAAGRLHAARRVPGVIWVQSYIYAFGGDMRRSAEKYDIQHKKWQKIPKMSSRRSCFTPNLYRNEIYLCLIMKTQDHFEAFHTERETYRALPFSYLNDCNGSVSFLVKDLLYIAECGQVTQWRPDMDTTELQLRFDMKGNDWATLSKLGPVHMEEWVYWVNYNTGELVEFSLQTCSIERGPEISPMVPRFQLDNRHCFVAFTYIFTIKCSQLTTVS